MLYYSYLLYLLNHFYLFYKLNHIAARIAHVCRTANDETRKGVSAELNFGNSLRGIVTFLQPTIASRILIYMTERVAQITKLSII